MIQTLSTLLRNLPYKMLSFWLISTSSTGTATPGRRPINILNGSKTATQCCYFVVVVLKMLSTVRLRQERLLVQVVWLLVWGGARGARGSSGPGHRGVHQRQQDGREEGRHAHARASPCHARCLAGALFRSLPRLVGCERKYHTALLIRLLIIYYLLRVLEQKQITNSIYMCVCLQIYTLSEHTRQTFGLDESTSKGKKGKW